MREEAGRIGKQGIGFRRRLFCALGEKLGFRLLVVQLAEAVLHRLQPLQKASERLRPTDEPGRAFEERRHVTQLLGSDPDLVLAGRIELAQLSRPCDKFAQPLFERAAGVRPDLFR